MNLKFVARGVAIGVLAAFAFALIGLGVMVPRTPLGRPPDPTPLPPTIEAPRGEMPRGPVGLAEYVQYRGSGPILAGSGFLLVLPNGDRVGLTTAHSVALGNPNRPVERVTFRTPGGSEAAAEFGSLYGAPGRARDGADLSVDYVLLRVDGPVDPTLFLEPDGRGGPQPGERVSLYSGVSLSGGVRLPGGIRLPGGRHELSGTVVSTDERAAWVLMEEETFNPAMMSGSPFVSQHTGQVVGMAIVASPRHLRLIPPRYRMMLGMHPIGSIVEKAEAADSYPALRTYRR